MRIHVVSLPHTETTRDYDWCAYTAKVRRFSTMMHRLGHEVFLYAGERNEAECTEHVPIVSSRDIDRWFPDWDAKTQVWPGWTQDAPWWRKMNARAFFEISQRYELGDTLGVIAGTCQAELASSLPELRAVEWGIGYSGVFAPFRVYESYAWAHHVAGLYREDDIRFYDAVIPNSFDPADLPFRERYSDAHGTYLLYLGRMTERKGLAVVEEIAKRHTVYTVGQGDVRVEGAEHLGMQLGKDKAELLGGAKAVLVPTTYLEPFGGVAVEAMMCGTPVITTDWGAFTETVLHDVTGYRCRTLGEFLAAVDLAGDLDRTAVRWHAVSNYSTNVVAPKYDAYFDQLAELDGAGWYTTGGKLAANLSQRRS